MDDWLSALPWLEEGGICSVLCPLGSGDVALVTALRRAAYAAHAGRGDLRVIEVESGPHLDSPLAACLGAFDLVCSSGKLRAAEALARTLRTEPTLFLVRFVGADRLEWWETLNDFADIYRKRYPSSPFAGIVLSSAPVIGIRPRFDFRQGWPEGIDLWSEDLGVRDRWASYLHARIAWEAAGSSVIAEDLEQRTWDLALGDDETLEQRFTDHAQERMKTDELSAQAWTRLVVSYGHRHQAIEQEGPARRADLWWNPSHSVGSRLAPWVCRAALLQKNLSGPAVWKLRSELVCEPLARDLFAICQQGEALIRSRAFQSGLKVSPSDETKVLLGRFQADTNRNHGYPLNHPARPTDAWAFASLGEVINAVTDRLPEPFRNLLGLRNTVAHGHFVGWHHVLTAMDLMRVAQ